MKFSYRSNVISWLYFLTHTRVVRVDADQTGEGRGVGDPTRIKIRGSSRLVLRAENGLPVMY